MPPEIATWKDVTFKVRRMSDNALVERMRALAEMRAPIELEEAWAIAVSGGARVPLLDQESIPNAGLSGEGLGEWMIERAVLKFRHGVFCRVIRDQSAMGYDAVTWSLVSLSPAAEKPNPRNLKKPLQEARPGVAVDIAEMRQLLARSKSILGAADGFQEVTVAAEKVGAHLARRELELGRLQELTETTFRKLNDKALELQERYDLEHQARIEQLTQKFESRSAKLEAENEKTLSELKEEAADLERRKKEFDDSENRHARRALQSELKVELSKRAETFRLTTGTRRMRWPIHAFTVLLLLLFGSGVVLSALDVSATWASLTEENISVDGLMPVLRGAGFLLAFSATSVFYLRWNHTWFQQHASEEFGLKRLELDLDRASWVVEMALEWRQETKSDLPSELLGRLTSNLFASPNEESEDLHPADQLASALLGSAAGLEVDLPGGRGRLNFGRRDLKKLRGQSRKSGTNADSDGQA